MTEIEAINELFASPSSDAANELLVIARLLSIEPQELFYKWESYVIKMGVDNTKLDYKTVKDFRKDLQNALDRESRAKGHAVQHSSKKAAPIPRTGGGADVFGMLDGMSSGTPAPKSMTKRKADSLATPAAKSVKNGVNSSPSEFKTPAPSTNGPPVAFEERQNAGQVVESINSHLSMPTAPAQIPAAPRVKLKANTELPKFAYKGMAMKLSEASEILDDRVDTFTDLVQEYHQLSDQAFGNPAAQSTAEVVAVGRIACDVPNGRLNAASLVLETSRRMGAGMRVPLRFENNLSYDLFPGKIVALRGTNVSGEYFSVSEVLELPTLPVAASTPSEFDVHNDRLTSSDGSTRPLSILLASGPYTTDLDLSFAPLHTLLAKAQAESPDVLILTGPFLDLDHPVIASGDVEPHLPADAKIDPDRATLVDVFRILVAEPIQALTRVHPSMTIILVPSTRDAISNHVSYPQDRFPRQPLGLPKQVQIVTNPITLSINEMVVGISSADILSELRRENVFQSAKGAAFQEDMLARLSSAIIEQRHYFPVYPPQAQENLIKPAPIPGEIAAPASEERLATAATLDLSYLKLAEWLNVRPDVLILPSVLSPFAKVCSTSDTACVMDVLTTTA